MIGLPKDLLSKGPAEAVGYHFVPPSVGRPPMRLFYPAKTPSSQRPIRWFQPVEGGVRPFLLGYAHLTVARHTTRLFRFVLQPLVYLLSFVLPMGWLRIHGVYESAEPDLLSSHGNNGKLPMIVFSHGLTGTGQENFGLCAAWAKQGFVVASVHHTDGSACNVRLHDGSQRYYQHGPPMKSYDPHFRPKQIADRALQVLAVCDYVQGKAGSNDIGNGSSPIVPTIQQAVDPSRTVVSGYSYGAATAARVLVMAPQRFAAAMFLDGWFFIDIESANVQFPFPKEAFDESFRHQVPSIFIDSAQFRGYPRLFDATKTLARRFTGGDDTVHVLSETGHQNFCDVVFWMSLGMLRKHLMGAVGTANEAAAYKEILDLTRGFLKKTVK